MANVQYTENMTEEQLDAMAGSETLRYQATSFGITRNNKVYSCIYSYHNTTFSTTIISLEFIFNCAVSERMAFQ